MQVCNTIIWRYSDNQLCFVLLAVSEGLQLAKASQLSEVVRKEVEAGKEVGKKLQAEKREQRAKLVVMHKVCVCLRLFVPSVTVWCHFSQVLVEECARLQHALEHCKLVLLAEAQETSLLHFQTQCCAMVNKLE